MPNPNPSPATRIGAANGPKPGQTKEQVHLARQNAERAMRIRDRFLRSLEAKLNDSAMEAVLAMIDTNSLKLLKDSEDRGLGAPVQPHTSPDGSMTPPARIIIEAAGIDASKLSVEALREIMNASNASDASST